MLAIFCLRLACGMIGALLVFSPRQVNPRFYRVQFLTVLGLTAGAALVLGHAAWGWLALALGGALILAFLGSVAWSLQGAPGGRGLMAANLLTLGSALALARLEQTGEGSFAWLLVGDLSSAAVLGTATTAMLMGHSYLIAPTMALAPLLRLLAALAAVTVVRMALSAAGLWFWTHDRSFVNLEDDAFWWLLVRWGVGFVGPLILTGMAWQTAKMRSTQSATGILYVAVIFCFLGELTGLLLLGHTGLIT